MEKRNMVFESRIPVFSRFIAKGMGVGLLIFLVVFAGIALSSIANGGKFSDLTPDIYFAMGFVGLIFFFTYAVMAIIFPNGFVSRIEINERGVSQVSLSPTKKVNKAAIIGGILTKSPGAVGAGLLAQAGDSRFLNWKEIRVVKVNKNSRYIYLSKGKLGLFPIGFFCPAEKYKEATKLIEGYFPNLQLDN